MIRIAIVGTGGMAHAHAQRFSDLPGCQVVAGVDIVESNLQRFCERFDISHAFSSVKELLDWGEFDAAAVVTNDSAHVPCSLPLVKAGKHVLCEKPIAPTAGEGKRLVTAAEKAGVAHMIHFSYRNAPVLHHAQKLVASGKLGALRHLEANYLQTWLTSPVWGEWRSTPAWLWRLSSAHGSKGALGDIGVHIVDLATFVANEPVKSVNCRLQTYDKAPGNRIGEYTLDANDSAFLRIELADGCVGTINASRWATGQINSLKLNLYGEKGALRIDLDKSDEELEVCLGADVKKGQFKTVKVRPTPNMQARFLRAIRTGKNDASDFRRGWEVQRVLDAAFRSDAQSKTIDIRNLK
ncbi:MAG: Gfo/Idh/MocA family protein [Kiritimatiellia bacterium]